MLGSLDGSILSPRAWPGPVAKEEEGFLATTGPGCPHGHWDFNTQHDTRNNRKGGRNAGWNIP